MSVRRRFRPVAVIVVGLLVVASAAALAAGTRKSVSGIFDARYCEVLELKGVPPTAVVTVWNSLGQNTCPESVWKTFDAAAIAKKDGDTLVILNGPRHFLMDSVTATVGGQRSFYGLRFTNAATIPITRAADLTRSTYSDRTIVRDNAWGWRAGRTLYELVAPGGDVYVMQSYAQIIDPKLSLSDLPTLGRRLTLPAGWRYRAVHLHKPFILNVSHTATVIQDDLQDTYQLATKPPSGKLHSHAVNLTGKTRTVKLTPGAVISVEDQGTIQGTPFGSGTVVLDGSLSLTNKRLTGTYRLVFPKGSVTGTVDMPFVLTGSNIAFTGTSRLTGGTGRYRGVTSGPLVVHDHNTFPDGQHGVLTVAGTVRYHG